MGQTFARTRRCAILGVVLFVAILAVGLNSSQVSADPCAAQLGYPVMGQQFYGYYGSNVLVTVPVSATCSFAASQLYAVGTAYDTTYNANVGTSNAVLIGTYGGNSFTGQLQFSLPGSVQAHSVQFSVSIYNAQAGYYQSYYGGSLLTTTSATFVVTPSTYQSSYPYYPGYNYYYGSYPYYNQNPGNYYYSNNNGGYYYNNNNQNPGNYYHNWNGGYHNNNQNPGNYYHNWNGGYHNNNQNPGNYYYSQNNNNQHCTNCKQP